ncbi:MAG: RES family NAD+ phosphorylase [Syntrophales bacterium]
MMTVYRIAKSEYIRDLSGKGPELYGGRWSPKGVPVVYASQTRALAALEFLGRMLGLSKTQRMPLSMASIEVPDNSTDAIATASLPGNWRQYPAPTALQNMGLKWINAGTFLLIKVPSAHVQQEYNILINPHHPDMASVKIVDVEPFIYDRRLAKPQRVPSKTRGRAPLS